MQIVEQAKPMADILACDVIAMMPQGVQLVKDWDGNGYRIANGGMVMAMIAPYRPTEVMDMIREAERVLVQKHVGDDEAFLVKGSL
jgi:hypothetical protein